MSNPSGVSDPLSERTCYSLFFGFVLLVIVRGKSGGDASDARKQRREEDGRVICAAERARGRESRGGGRFTRLWNEQIKRVSPIK